MANPMGHPADIAAGKKAKAVQLTKRDMCSDLYELLASDLESKAVDGDLDYGSYTQLTSDQQSEIVKDVAEFLRTYAKKMKKAY